MWQPQPTRTQPNKFKFISQETFLVINCPLIFMREQDGQLNIYKFDLKYFFNVFVFIMTICSQCLSANGTSWHLYYKYDMIYTPTDAGRSTI